MTGILVPPAQAEALFDVYPDFDAQDDLRDGFLADLRCRDRAAGQPWRDDDSDELSVLSGSLSCSPRPAPSFGPAR